MTSEYLIFIGDQCLVSYNSLDDNYEVGCLGFYDIESETWSGFRQTIGIYVLHIEFFTAFIVLQLS